MKSPSKPAKPAKPNTFKGFVNFYLSPQDKSTIKAEVMNDGEVTKFLITLADRGYKFGCTLDRVHGCYLCSATGVGADNPNLGYATTARHADFYTAVTALWYQLSVLADDGVWPLPNEIGGEFDW